MIKCQLNDFLPGTGGVHRNGRARARRTPPTAPLGAAAAALGSPRGGSGSAKVPRAPSVPPRDSGLAEPGTELAGKGRAKKTWVEMPEKREISALPCAGAACGWRR